MELYMLTIEASLFNPRTRVKLPPTSWANVRSRKDPGAHAPGFMLSPASRVGQHFVHGTAAKALQIERHVLESQLTKSRGKLIDHIFPQHAVHLGLCNLEPDQFVVMTHSELTKPKLSQDLFATIDLA